jgi:probable HAF family extracellular repeat protein
MQQLIHGLFVAAALAVTPLADAAKPGPSYAGRSLGALPGDDQSRGEGVNNAGSVVGLSWSSTADGERAFYWDRATDVLYQLTTSGATGAAYAIAGSSGGVEYAVGYERAAGGSSRAVIWTAPPSSVPIFLDGDGSSALGVNDSGVAVGYRSGVPVIWTPDGSNGYVATTINLLPNQQFGFAEDINNAGIVVGYNAVLVTLS